VLFQLKNKSSETLKIGDKTVHVRKITIVQWRELFDSIQAIPQLIVTVVTAPASDKPAFFVMALRESFDDIVRVTSVLTGIDEDYIAKNASVDELVKYFAALARVNNFGELLKDAQSALGSMKLRAQPQAKQA